MGHDASKVLLGSTLSSSKEGSEVFASDPATYPAGTAVRRANTGLLSVTKADGNWVGISLGKSLSDHKKTGVLFTGEIVPILLEAAPARGVVEITSYADLIETSNFDTLKVGATTFTFKGTSGNENEVAAVTSNTQTASNLVVKINAHSIAGPLFKATSLAGVVTITAKNNATDGADIDLVYTDVGSSTIGIETDDIVFTGGAATAADYVVIGEKVYISDTTGKADDPNSLATICDAVYVSGVKTGIAEDGSEVACALIDMAGGL